MNVGALGTSNILRSALQAQNVSAKAMQVADDEIEVVRVDDPAASGIDAKSARAAIDKQLADDVASGKISQEDADKIGKALDEIDGSDDEADPADSAPSSAGKPAGGGGGGGGSDEKTELMRTETVSGGIKTTTITYTDGTTATETSVDTAAKDSDSASAVSDAGGSKAAGNTGLSDYLSTIPPGSTFNAYA